MTRGPKHMASPEVTAARAKMSRASSSSSQGRPRHLAPSEGPSSGLGGGVGSDTVPMEAVQEAGQEAAVAIGRNTALMSALVIVSRITGFFRTWGQAYALGVTVMASCYSVANNLPNQLYEIVVGGMLVTAFLPVYLSIKRRLGVEGASAYTSNLVSIVLLLMGAVAALGFVFAAQVVWTQSFGATSEFDSELAAYFFRFFVIEVVLYSLSSIFSGVLNAERDYLWSSAAPIINNFVTTASFLAYAWLVDSDPSLALIVLALGNPLGVAVQVLVQLPALKRHGIRLRWRIDLRDPAIKETLTIGVPTIVVMLCSFETTSVMNSSALSVTGAGASISYYARLWFTLPYAILAVPITTAMFTELSVYVAESDLDSYKRGVADGTSQILFHMIPFMLYLIVFARPLVGFISAGRFSPDEIGTTTQYLQALSVSLPLYGVNTYLQKVCSSMRRMSLYARAHVIAALIQTALCLLLTPILGLNFVALSSAAYMLLVDMVSFVGLRRQLGPMGLWSVVGCAVRASVFGVTGAAVGFAVLSLLARTALVAAGTLGSIACLMLAGIPALVVTYGIALATKAPEAGMVSRLLGRVLRRGVR